MEKKETNHDYNKGKQAYDSQNYEEAVDYFEDAVKATPNKYAYFYLGQALGKLKRHEQAIEALNKTFDMLDKDKEPRDHAVVLQCLAEQHRRLDSFAKAKEEIELAWSICSKAFEGRDLTHWKYELDKDRSDIKDAEAYAETHRFDRYFKQAEEMERRRSYREAIDVYSKCLAERPSLQAYFRRGRCYFFLQQHKEALADHTKCSECPQTGIQQEKDTLTECEFYQGLCCAELGEFKQAATLLRKVAERRTDTRLVSPVQREAARYYSMVVRRMEA